MAIIRRRRIAGLFLLLLSVAVGAACSLGKPGLDPASRPASASSAGLGSTAIAGATPSSTASGDAAAPRVGGLAPDFELASLTGGSVRLADYRGKTVLLNFWATWCPPCKEEMPALDALYREQREQGLVVLAVDVGEDAATVRQYVEAGKFSFPVALDQEMTVSLRYETLSLPTTYFIDGEGIVREKVVGAMTRQQMDEHVAKARAAGGKPMASPVSIARMAGTERDLPVARVGDRQIALGEVDRRLDLQLALERLQTGETLDPRSPTGGAELKQRQEQALKTLVEEELLVRAAQAAGIPDPAAEAVDEEVGRLAELAGSTAELDRELGRHGATLDDLRQTVRRGLLAQRFVEERLLTADAQGSPDEVIRRWLDQERTRVGVTIQNDDALGKP